MGSGSNSGAINLYCKCHGKQKMAILTPEGLEVMSRHHGTYHVGSLSVPDLLRQIAGTVDGSAILGFVAQAIRP